MVNLKNDKYRKVRGGYARTLKIYCQKCNAPLVVYQKDGAGPLKRLYIDRIFSSLSINSKVLNRQNTALKCNKCQLVLGVKYIYEPENRKAYRLFAHAVYTKAIKLNNHAL